MGILDHIASQAHRATAETVSGGAITRSSPWSPNVPEELSSWLPDLYVQAVRKTQRRVKLVQRLMRMPLISFDRFPISLPWESAKAVDPEEHNVWILDNTAYRNEGQWKAEFVACYFIKNSGRDLSKVVASIADKLDIGPDDTASRHRIAQRLQPFADKVLPKRTVEIVMGDGKQKLKLGPSTLSGISSETEVLNFEAPTSMEIASTPPNLPSKSALPGTTEFATPDGWAILSDIDDTIKVTQTPSPIGILESTFLVETPEPVKGMPELYARLKKQLQDPPFFYLSASPYNLYPFLREFQHAHFPHGTTVLRDASWQNIGGLIASLSRGTQAYKSDRITKMHSWLPDRRFIAIGDSTQTDPESYGECARKFPGWIGAIFIRKVTGIAEMNQAEKNSDERFEKAFKGLDRSLWHVFTDPQDIADRVDKLVGQRL